MKINHAINHCGTLYAPCALAAQISFREAPHNSTMQESRETNKNRASLGDARFFPADGKCFLFAPTRERKAISFFFLISGCCVAEKKCFLGGNFASAFIIKKGIMIVLLGQYLKANCYLLGAY